MHAVLAGVGVHVTHPTCSAPAAGSCSVGLASAMRAEVDSALQLIEYRRRCFTMREPCELTINLD